MDAFNNEAVYDEKISPLVKEILSICKEHKIPMVCSFAFEHDSEKGTGRSTSYVNFPDRKDDRMQEAFITLRRQNDISAAIVISNT